MAHHVVITGTGRAGTTFLMQLFTALKLDTGFADVHQGIDRYSHGGMEKDVELRPGMPYFVKTPHFCTQIDKIIADGFVIDYIIVPFRKLEDAAESRRRILSTTRNKFAAGSLVGTHDPSDQEDALIEMIYYLFYSIAKYDIPLILLHFPRLITDSDYLYSKLQTVLGDITKMKFSKAFQEVSDPKLIHINSD